MKALAVTACILALTAAAAAKPTPVSKINPMDELAPASAPNDVDINSGPAGALLEREYFQAPQKPFTHGGLPCRFQSTVFDKVRLAQLCR
jgi:hypothetical protein